MCILQTEYNFVELPQVLIATSRASKPTYFIYKKKKYRFKTLRLKPET